MDFALILMLNGQYCTAGASPRPTISSEDKLQFIILHFLTFGQRSAMDKQNNSKI